MTLGCLTWTFLQSCVWGYALQQGIVHHQPPFCYVCIASGQWRRACVCCEALMRGCNDRAAVAAALSSDTPFALPGEIERTPGVTAQLATPAVLEAAAAAPAAAPAAKQQQQMWGIMGFGGLFVDNFQLPKDAETVEDLDKKHDPLAKGQVSWGAPLQRDWLFTDAPKRPISSDASGDAMPWSANGGAALVAAATAVAAAAQPPPAAALSLAMRLVEGSQAAGITGQALASLEDSCMKAAAACAADCAA